MSLWDIIRDFFVRYVFGGVDSSENFYFNYFGNIIPLDDSNNILDGFTATTGDISVKLYDITSGDGGSLCLNFGDYLSTTATIIVMVLLCILLVKLAIWIFKLGANLIRLR